MRLIVSNNFLKVHLKLYLHKSVSATVGKKLINRLVIIIFLSSYEVTLRLHKLTLIFYEVIIWFLKLHIASLLIQI